MDLALVIKIVIGLVAFAAWVAGKIKAEAGQPAPIAVPPPVPRRTRRVRNAPPPLAPEPEPSAPVAAVHLRQRFRDPRDQCRPSLATGGRRGVGVCMKSVERIGIDYVGRQSVPVAEIQLAPTWVDPHIQPMMHADRLGRHMRAGEVGTEDRFHLQRRRLVPAGGDPCCRWRAAAGDRTAVAAPRAGCCNGWGATVDS